jgi:hypothetical protein
MPLGRNQRVPLIRRYRRAISLVRTLVRLRILNAFFDPAGRCAAAVESRNRSCRSSRAPLDQVRHGLVRDCEPALAHDQAGHDHVAAVAPMLAPFAAVIKIVELGGLRDKGDISDWIDAPQLSRLVSCAPGSG